MNTKKYIWFLIGILCPIYGSLLGQNPTGNEQPNFILILADDQGWDGTSVQMDEANIFSKSDYYRTPNLERLASEGMKFSRAYSASPVCSPSRYAILTGLSPARLGMTDIIKRNPAENVPLAAPNGYDAIDPTLTTLPQALKSIDNANYLCASYGKWHMGPDAISEAGFDFSDGNNENGAGNSGDTFNEDPKRIFSITQNGLDFIDDAMEVDRPFFLQLNHYAVHLWPQSKLETFETVGTYEKGNHFHRGYCAMTQDLDESVGILMDYLTELGIADNTYIIYTSDNGSVESTVNIPISPSAVLQKGKTFVWEGGIRVPMIVRGPGVIAGSQSDQTFNGTDIFATVLDLAGHDGSVVNDEDAKSMKPFLLGQKEKVSDARVYHFPHYSYSKKGIPQSAIIVGDNKFSIDFWTGESQLFNVQEDPSESFHIKNAALLKMQMHKQLRDYLLDVDALLPTFNPAFVRYSGTFPDYDEDGMNDEWEFKQFLTGAFSGEGDFDGDGFSNLEEFEFRTDPISPNDFPDSASADSSLETGLEVYDYEGGIRLKLSEGAQTLLLSDITGRIIYQQKLDQSRYIDLPLSEDLTGLFLLKVESKDGAETRRIIR